jgi:hypothetical protein
MTGRMLASILSVYDGASFDRREKVKLLYYFNLFTMLLFSLILVLINSANIFALAAGVNYILAAFIAVPFSVWCCSAGEATMPPPSSP